MKHICMAVYTCMHTCGFPHFIHIYVCVAFHIFDGNIKYNLYIFVKTLQKLTNTINYQKHT